jgi:hypothetical protein
MTYIPEYLQSYRPTFAQYLEARKRPGISTARAALHNAKYMLYRAALLRQWDDAGGDIVDSYAASDDWSEGDSRVRIVAMPDDHCQMDDLKGDCFNPRVNSDINPNKLARDEKEFEERVASEGVWGFRAEYWNYAEWIETDSIWGLVGDDFIGSCCDDDLMESALNGLSECLKAEAEAIEETRPDLYN